MVQLERRRFTVEEFDRMAQAGILDEDDRLELIDGEIVAMNPIGPLHAASVDNAGMSLTLGLGRRAIVRIQGALVLDGDNEVYPDVAVLRAHPGGYRRHHPRPEDVVVVVEVADTTLACDRRVKLPLYARAGIQEFWLVDLGHERVYVYTNPMADGYQTVRTLRRPDTLTLDAFPDVQLPVADLLG